VLVHARAPSPQGTRPLRRTPSLLKVPKHMAEPNLGVRFSLWR